MFVYSLVPLSSTTYSCSLSLSLSSILSLLHTYFTFFLHRHPAASSQQTASDKQLVDITICMLNERILTEYNLCCYTFAVRIVRFDKYIDVCSAHCDLDIFHAHRQRNYFVCQLKCIVLCTMLCCAVYTIWIHRNYYRSIELLSSTDAATA